jgi:tRNA(Ile2) C34 agmatinyltransferase TiaS
LTPLCEDCGSPLGSTGKCVNCIVKRAAQAQEAQHPTNEAHQFTESTT